MLRIIKNPWRSVLLILALAISPDILAQATNPAPTLTTALPDSILAGSPATPIILSGSNFIPISTVQVDEIPVATAFVSPLQLSAVIPASRLESPAVLSITVVNPSPGGGRSHARAFHVYTESAPNPKPILLSIDPVISLQGSSLFMTLSGSDFIPSSVTVFGGADLPTTFVDSSKLIALVGPDRLNATGNRSVAVFTSPPGGGTSELRSFAIVSNLAPVIASAVLQGTDGATRVAPGSTATLRITGQNLLGIRSVNISGGGITTRITGGDATSVSALIDVAALPLGVIPSMLSVFRPVLYDPISDSWIETARVPVLAINPIGSRFGHTATLLLNGRVFLAGGQPITNQDTENSYLFEEVKTPAAPDREFLLALDAGSYTAIIELSSGQPAGAWGMQIITEGSLPGGASIGGGFDIPSRENGGFGAFVIDRSQTVTALLSSKPLLGEPPPAVTLRLSDSKRLEVVAAEGSATTGFSRVLTPGFYVVEVVSKAGRGKFELQLQADQFSGGIIAGGYITQDVTGFAGFRVLAPQKVTIRLYRTAYGAKAAGSFNLTVLDSFGHLVFRSDGNRTKP